MRERYAHLFAGFSEETIKIYEANMAKESEKKMPPGFENASEADKQALLKRSEVLERSGVVEKGDGSQAGGISHGSYDQRARVKEMPGVGGVQGVKTSTTTYDHTKPAPRIDLADPKQEHQHASTPALSEKYPEVKKAYEDKSQGDKDGIAAQKGKVQDQQKGQEGKENGREI